MRNSSSVRFRESKPGRFREGRPRIGISKKYNITLPDYYYYSFNEYIKKHGYSASSFLRELIIDFIDSKKMLN